MEMALGLTLGMVLGGGVKKGAGACCTWRRYSRFGPRLVLCGSEAGLIAMMAEVIVGAFLVSGFLQSRHAIGRFQTEWQRTGSRLLRFSGLHRYVLVCFSF